MDCNDFFDFDSLNQYVEFDKPLYSMITKRRTAKLVYMAPKQYIYRIAQGFGGMSYDDVVDSLSVVKSNIDKYAEAMKSGAKFPIGYYTKDGSGQEGRRRALAAMKLGCDKIPVIQFMKISDKEFSNVVNKLKGKSFDELDALFKKIGFKNGITKLGYNDLQRYVEYNLNESYDDVGVEHTKENQTKLYDLKDISVSRSFKNFTIVNNKYNSNSGLLGNVVAYNDEDGTEVGNASYGYDYEGGPLKASIDVRPDMRRLGIGSEMYKFIEEITGEKLNPEPSHSKSAENFWNQPNREFGLKEFNSAKERPIKKRIVAGVLIKCVSTGNVFLLLRNDSTPIWALVSGTIDEGENVLDGLKRELYEELFVRPSDIDFKFIRIENIPEKNTEFHYYEGFVDRQFTPIMDEENLDGRWFSMNTIPRPLYKGLPEKLEKIFKNPEVKMSVGEKVFSEVRSFVRKVLRESVLSEITKANFEAFHGSEHLINKFEDSFLSGEKVTQHHGAGIYFTTDYENARMFGKNVYKVSISGTFLDRNSPPSSVDIGELISLMKMSDDEWEMEAYNYNEDPDIGIMMAAKMAVDYADNEADVFLRVQSSWYQHSPLDYVRNMTKLGYDGMIVDAPSDFVGGKHIILFNPDAVRIVEKLR